MSREIAESLQHSYNLNYGKEEKSSGGCSWEIRRKEECRRQDGKTHSRAEEGDCPECCQGKMAEEIGKVVPLCLSLSPGGWGFSIGVPSAALLEIQISNSGGIFAEVVSCLFCHEFLFGDCFGLIEFKGSIGQSQIIIHAAGSV